MIDSPDQGQAGGSPAWRWQRALLLMASVAAASCADPPARPTAAGGVSLTPEVSDQAQVVARVDGRPILASDLRAQMRGGQDRRQALRELIKLELLAREAQRKGLGRSPQVVKAQRRAMANHLVRKEFADGFTKASIPVDLVDTAYKRVKGFYVHPNLARVWHILLEARRKDSAQTHARARTQALKVHAMATAGPITLEQFKALAEKVDRGTPPLKVTSQAVFTARHSGTVPPFANAALDLKTPRQVSPVVKTIFGYHVLFLIERRPARDVSRSEADAEIREKIFDKAKSASFHRWVSAMEQKYKVAVHLEVLGQAQRVAPAPARRARP